MTAEILSVGTELLLGNIVNTNARDLSVMLSELGINVYYHSVVGDNPERVRLAVEVSKKRADVLITTGGLGPTYDDLTKDVLASAFGKKLVYHEECAEDIRAYFAKRRRDCEVTENNYRQAYLPEGCTVFRNTCGTAPGCAFFADGIHIIMLPGPPHECVTMFKVSAAPYLRKFSDGRLYSHNIHIFGLGESATESKLHSLMVNLKNPTLAPYVGVGEVRLRLTAKARSEEEAESMMSPIIDEVRKTLGDVIYGVDIGTLENAVFTLLKEQHKTLSSAESCTGGLLAKRITDVSGASAVFRGGAVTYATDTKHGILGVSQELLDKQGAVCRETALQMAEGARQIFKSDISAAITGIAGPDSDGSGKPAGLVYVAIAADGNMYCRELFLGGDRDRVRVLAVNHALDMVRRYLAGLNILEGADHK